MDRRTRTSAVPLVLSMALALSLAGAPEVAAELRQSGFLSDGSGVAQWIQTETPKPWEPDDRSVIELSVNGSGFAMARFAGFSGEVPDAPPSYDFRASTSGSSGGSPRLILRLGTGVGELRPLNVVAGEWVHMDGLSSDWDSRGGTCGFRPQVSYAEVRRCHPGGTVTGLDIWNDSAWLFPGLYQVQVDNITLAGERVSNQDTEALKQPSQPPFSFSPTVEVEPGTSGPVLVKVPKGEGTGDGTGKFVTLSEVANVPVGSVLDASQGDVTLTPIADTTVEATFSQGAFRIVPPSGSQDRRITALRMRGGIDVPCSPGRAHAARLVRQLNSDVRRRRRHRASRAGAAARGKEPTRGFRILARYSTATAQDATWVTIESCHGTRTRVSRGRVAVRDLGRRRSKVLGAGQSYLARR